MNPADRIIAALSADATFIEVLSALSPAVQQSLQDRVRAAVETELATLQPPAAPAASAS